MASVDEATASVRTAYTELREGLRSDDRHGLLNAIEALSQALVHLDAHPAHDAGEPHQEISDWERVDRERQVDEERERDIIEVRERPW